MYLNWAAFTESKGEDASVVFNDLLKKIPHSKFTFTKVWIQFAYYCLRQGQLDKARKVFG